MVPFIGLTGGIGAGKSTALAALEDLGAAVVSTDAIVHELYETDAVRDAVAGHFGPEVTRGGSVDRAELARRAFATADGRAWLERLLWPLVGARMATWRTGLEQLHPRPRAAVVEVPLLFEAGMEGAFDTTIAVIAEEGTRVARAAARGHAALDERAARQLSQPEKAERADFVVLNDGTPEALRSELSGVLEKLKL